MAQSRVVGKQEVAGTRRTDRKGCVPGEACPPWPFSQFWKSAILSLRLQCPFGEVDLQANFAEETPITQYADRGFLAPFGNNGESHLAGLQINTASTGPPCAKKVCFFGKSKAFLPSPMVARNAWGANSRLLLESRGRREEREGCAGTDAAENVQAV